MNTEVKEKVVIYNDVECKILRVWDGGYYDLQTKNKTERGIIEQYLSVHEEELCVGNQVSDTDANAINTLLTAGAYLGSLVGKEVSVEPGFIYECRGFNLNENGSGTLYGKNGFCTFGSYKAVRPCR